MKSGVFWMRTNLSRPLFVAFLYTMSVLLTVATAQGVVTLEKSNFKSTIDSNPLVIVSFYAPWCRYSRELLPEYAKVATILQGEMVVASVDISVEAGLSNEEHITHVPSVKFWKDGNLIATYNGARKSDAIVNWARYLTKEIPELTTELLQQAESENKAVLIGFYKVDSDSRKSVNSKGVDYHTVPFLQIQDALAEIPIIFTTSDENKRSWAEDWGASGDKFPTVGLLYWNKPELNMDKFIPTAPVSARINIRMWNEDVDLTPNRVKEWIAECLSPEKDCPAWRKSQPRVDSDSTSLRTIVGKNFEEIVYDLNKDVLVYFGDEDLPSMVNSANTQILPTTTGGASAVTDNSHSVDNSGSVTHADSSSTSEASFTSNAVTSTNTVTPSLAMLMEVADTLGTVPTVVVGHINIRKNGFPDKVREQLPRLYAFVLFPANNKEHFVVFNGKEETSDALLKFIAENAFIPFEIPAKKLDKAANPNVDGNTNDGSTIDGETTRTKHWFVCSWATLLNTIYTWLGLFWIKV